MDSDFSCPNCRGIIFAAAAGAATALCPHCREAVPVPSRLMRPAEERAPAEHRGLFDSLKPAALPPERRGWKTARLGLTLEAVAGRLLFVGVLAFLPLTCLIVGSDLTRPEPPPALGVLNLAAGLATVGCALLVFLARTLCAAAPSRPARLAAVASAAATLGVFMATVVLAVLAASRHRDLVPAGCAEALLLCGGLTAELFFVLHLRAVARSLGDGELANRPLVYLAGSAAGVVTLVALSALAPLFLHRGWELVLYLVCFWWMASVAWLGWRLRVVQAVCRLVRHGGPAGWDERWERAER